MPRGIRRRLVVALLAVAAVPLVGVGMYAMQVHTEALTRLAVSAARERVELKARKAEELLGGLRSDVVFLARSPVMMSLFDEAGGRRRLEGQFLSFTGTKPVFASLFYLDEEGDEIVGARNDGQRSWPVPTEHLQRRALATSFRAAMAQAPGEVYVEALDREAGGAPEPVVRYAVRVADRDDRRRGVLVADLFARRLVDAVRDEHSITWLLDETGWTVSPSAEPPPRAEEAAALRERLRSVGTLVQADTGGSLAWTLVYPGSPGAAPSWLLAERVPEAAVFADLRRFRVIFAGFVALVAVAATALSLVLAARIARPLYLLRQGAQRLAGGDLAHRLDVRTGDEIEQLASEFNRMGAALEDSYRQLATREAAKSERLEEISRQLLQSERLAAVGELAAGVAHEINNPVGVMSMYVQQLLESEGLDARQRQKLAVVERHAERLARITGGLLDFARDRDYRRDPFPAARPVRRAMEALAPRLHEARVRAELREEAAAAKTQVIGDEESLQQVFENLILNAIQAAPGGHVDIAVRALCSEIEVSVSDDGPGIEPEHIERLFEPFFTTKEVGQGTGLGLAISYGIVRAHEGRMQAGNRDGGGACLKVVLPAARQMEGEPP